MKYYVVRPNRRFVGRRYYWQRLTEIDSLDESAVIVVYGRRRIGKTELLEQFFRNKPILKFEGLQPDRAGIRRDSPDETRRQIDWCLRKLDQYSESGVHFQRMNVPRWGDFFELLLPFVDKAEVVLYFEELQWLANYRDDFLSELKPYWDDTLRHNPKLRVIVSGSSPAFIVNQFVSTSAMYNRSNHMLKLEPFDLREIGEFMGKGKRESLLAAIAVGGVPEYLKQLKGASSVYTALCEKSFRPGEFFRKEKDTLFVSSLASNRDYEDILDGLARCGHCTRTFLYKKAGDPRRKRPGGSFSTALDDLVQVDFVERYTPLTVKNRRGSRTAHYAIADEYLHFYYRLIERRIADIDAGKFIDNPAGAVRLADFNKLMGYAFERWCRKNEWLIAKHMKFAGVVEYQHGAWFEKSSVESDGFQIDLMFIRKDSRIIFCEVRYNVGMAVTRDVAREVQTKIDRFIERNPKYRSHTLDMALITMEPVARKPPGEEPFAYLIAAEDLLE